MKNRQGGFTLVEVMFAIAILAIATTGIGSAYFSIISSNRFVNDRARSFKAAHQTMESLLALPIDDMVSYNGKNFTDVYNRTQAGGVVTWTGELDQGTDEVAEGAGEDGVIVDAEPKTQSAEGKSKVTIISLDGNWQEDAVLDATADTFKVLVSVDDFNVTLSYVRTRY